jgi:hypothetical protein
MPAPPTTPVATAAVRALPRIVAAIALWLAAPALAARAVEPPPTPLAEPLPEAIAPPAAASETVGEPPALYVPDPLDSGSFAGLPATVVPESFPRWPRWFAGATGLVMTRTLPTGVPVMQPAGGTQLTTTSGGLSWPGGVDLHIGRWFGTRQHNAVEFIYWGVFGMGSTTSVGGGGITAIPQADATVGGTPAADYLTSATRQEITRSDLVNDIEINWLYSLWDRPEFMSRDPGSPSRSVNLMWLAGFRFFQLEDVLAASTSSATAGSPLDFNVATNNNLYGGQVGAKFDWRFANRLRFNTVPKFMLAGNSITNTSTLATAAGTPAVFTGSGVPVNVHSTLGVFSWLGSVDAGLAWDVTDHWSLSLGYRVVGVGNIAQADGEWPTLITNESLTGIAAGSSTIIHGGFAGFEGRY